MRIFHGPRRIIAETDLVASNLVSASPESRKLPWSETDRRYGSCRLQPGERLSLELEIILVQDGSSPRRTFPPPARRAPLLRIQKTYSSPRRIIVETDLSASSPVSASPENKNIHGPRRIIGETDLVASNPVSASPENKNISWSETDHHLVASSPVSASPENKNISWSSPRRILSPPAR